MSSINHFTPFIYQRRRSRVVNVGAVAMGGDNPIRVQSMTTTDTMDTKRTVDQVMRLADATCEIVRITAPTVLEAKNLENIKSALLQKKCPVPLVADIHFRPDAALVAADFVEKVRINPGNYVDAKAFRVRDYTDQQYEDELKRIEEKFTPLVLKLKQLKKALRIGTNHGSLSDRIMNRYGDSPLGMVESALEFVRICRKNDFHDIVLSMKASNPRIMISANRLLASRMDQENMDYPFHLGVTEAGDGEDGRIKSAIGIGSLLEDGIGDTIRVSLTEEPEMEIPVAYELVRRPLSFKSALPISSSLQSNGVEVESTYVRRETQKVRIGGLDLGGDAPIRVISRVSLGEKTSADALALIREVGVDSPVEIIQIPSEGKNFDSELTRFSSGFGEARKNLALWIELKVGQARPSLSCPVEGWVLDLGGGPINKEEDVRKAVLSLAQACATQRSALVLQSGDAESLLRALEWLQGTGAPLVLSWAVPHSTHSVHPLRSLINELKKRNVAVPLCLVNTEPTASLAAAVFQGSLLCDGFGDAVLVSSGPLSKPLLDSSYSLLQACGLRITKADYVSCPSCGRTLFDLQATTEKIKEQTKHLKGVKIAIMGCIVNGPGEMADADFGYVGGGPGKINLYVGKTCVDKSIPAEVAVERLIELIKAHGRWRDPLAGPGVK